jgi:hypothetical protein
VTQRVPRASQSVVPIVARSGVRHRWQSGLKGLVARLSGQMRLTQPVAEPGQLVDLVGLSAHQMARRPPTRSSIGSPVGQPRGQRRLAQRPQRVARCVFADVLGRLDSG